ncbi:AMP-binding protein [Streptomyces sp. NEAU-174]|uniref:AMP-binding protein n=1 Tax=Streptomyces sp. NEAU-174 TaxID=3458254 RepID=UPI004044A846
MANIGLTPRTPELVGRRRLGGAWKSETLVKRWQRVADAHPDREAVVAPDGRLSHAELPPASHRIAVGLLRQGLVPGNRVILQSGNSFGTILARYGPLKARAGTGEHASGSPTPRDRDDCAAGRGYGPLAQEQPEFDVHKFTEEMAAVVPSLRVRLTLGASRGTAGIRIEDLTPEPAAPGPQGRGSNTSKRSCTPTTSPPSSSQRHSARRVPRGAPVLSGTPDQRVGRRRGPRAGHRDRAPVRSASYVSAALYRPAARSTPDPRWRLRIQLSTTQLGIFRFEEGYRCFLY